MSLLSELFRSSRRLARLFLAFGMLLFALSAQAQVTPPYPVIFVHGLNSSGKDFQAMKNYLDPTGVLTGERLIAWSVPSGPLSCSWSHDWSTVGVSWTPISGPGVLPASRRYFAIDFSSNDGLTLSEQGKELKQVIDCVKEITSTTKVILVAHSMGGLAARAYLQGFARNKNDVFPMAYGDDVAQLITVGTPHLGSYLPILCQQNPYSALECWGFTLFKSAWSVAMNSLKPPPEGLELAMMNSLVSSPLQGLPNIRYTSIIIRGTRALGTPLVGGESGDGIVRETSQNLASLFPPSSPIPINHNPIDINVASYSCDKHLVETHTCEPRNSLVMDSVKSEILNVPLALRPSATTSPPNPSTISATSATLVGHINPAGKTTTARFEWGVTTNLEQPPTSQQNLAAGANDVPISATLNGLANGTKYFYRAVANNADGTTRGDILQFTTPAVGVASLPAPSLFTPTPYAWSQSTTPSFSWSPVANAPSYRIMVATDPNALPTDKSSATCMGCAINITSTTSNYIPPAGALNAGTLYWWQVKARGATEYGDWSGQQVFATAMASTTPLPSPTLTAPISGNTTASATPLMSWTTVSGADSYWIMVADNPADLPTASESLTCPLCSVNDIFYVNSYTPSSGKLVSGRNYFWKVKARNTTTSGTWSSPVGAFVTGGVPAPSDAACGTAAGGTFTSMPTSNLCTTGTPSAVSSVGPWFWSCSANGHDQNCLANIQSYTVSTSATGNGTITPASETINLGSAATFTVAPDIGSRASVSGCGINQNWITSPVIVTTTSITGGCTVTATFTPNPVTKYSKICNNGQDAGQGSCPATPALGGGATDWACTRDNTNGLLWEVKTNDGGLRDHNNTYTWYDINPANNGGNPGTKNGGVCVGSRCDTTGFADAVSATGLCGANDWRMPTHDELVALVDATSANNGLPAIDGSYFPNTLGAPYWSGTPYNGVSIAGVFGTSDAAWEMNFFHEFADGTYPRAWDNRVRLVRGGSVGSPFDLTVSLVGSGSVTSSPAGINCGITCTASLTGGSSVTLSAAPNSGYSFTGWSGACAGTDTTCTVAMSQYREVTATFSSLAVSGTCGSINGYYLAAQPIANLCSAGAASAVTGSGPWNWSCSGSGGGATAMCTAYLQPGGTPLPSTPITGFSSGITAAASPYGITAGFDGNLWFTEMGGNRIGRITPVGVITEFSAGITAGASPYGITAGSDGNLWFTEFGPDKIGRITPSGTVTEFNLTVGASPMRITAGPDGNLWFTGYNRIGRITPSGVIIEFSAGITAGSNPQDITAGSDGNLWFTESSGNRIGRITPAGVVTELSVGISSGASPYGITAGPDGNVWFTESGGNRIGRITPSGTVTEFSAGISSTSYSITAGSDGNLWFMEIGNNRVARITPAGVVTEFNSSNLQPVSSITSGPDGNLWFAVPGNNLIGRITIGGSSGSGVTTVSLGTALPFSAQVGTTSAVQSVTLSNTGSASLNIASIVANGDFAQSNDCGLALASGASCTISVTFTPTAAGPRNGNLTITSDAIGNPHLVSLSGTGVAVAVPEVSLDTTSLSFATQTVGTSSVGQGVTLTNIGNAALSTGSITVNGDFMVTTNCDMRTLAPGEYCQLGAQFAPTTAGVLNGNINIVSNAAGTPHVVSLSGTGVAIPAVMLNLVSGWNLLGNSNNAPFDVASTLGDTTKVTTVWKWVPTTSKWAFYAPSMTSTNLATYAASKNYDVLATVNGGEGFWVNAKTAFAVQLPAGTLISTSYFQDQTDATQNKLLKGWNLIATGDSITPSAFNLALSTTPPAQGVIPLNVTTLWAWDSGLSNWYFYAPSLELSGGLANYITSKNYLDFTQHSKTLGQGVGFWVNKP